MTVFENSFSRRKGYTPPPIQGKPEQLSNAARIRLWNIFYSEIWVQNHNEVIGIAAPSPDLTAFFEAVWTDLDGRPVDGFPGAEKLLEQFKGRFFTGAWHFPFDIFEELLEGAKDMAHDPHLVGSLIRNALERENQAYTFVGGRFVERMTLQEIESVETGLQIPIEGVRVHLTDALQKLSDRENPDFRNSIKESISAVESACRHLTKRENAMLPDALKLLDSQRPFHPAFRESLVKLYGWTSDEGGIRHAIKDADKVERADAQYMLVACSAFVNYLMTR
jgi:hypothetical protein